MPLRAKLMQGAARIAAAVWLGMVVTLGAVVAPALFASLERSQAGGIAGQLFGTEARVGLGLGIVLLVIGRLGSSARLPEQAVSAEFGGPRFPIGLALGAVFCTVLGYFALQPMMAPARSGVGPLTFGQLHALSGLLFGLKGLCLLGLVWRLR